MATPRSVGPHRGVAQFRTWGTNVTLALDDDLGLAHAESLLRRELDAIDRACSRFRPDSEIWSLYPGGRAVTVSPLLFEIIATALAVAERTGGAVDPTVGSAVEALGYDRDFTRVPALGPALDRAPVPAPGWSCIEHDAFARTIRVPPGVHLDVGATAKALAADRAAARIASSTGSAALVCVGGDISVAGPSPHGGWSVAVAVDSSGPFADGPIVAIDGGGLASSSTVVRSWRRGGRRLHHIVDPATGDSASEYWRLVSVAAATCVDANAATTASVVWGRSASHRLEAMGLPARLVRHDGVAVTVAGWPADEIVATPNGSRQVGAP